MNLLYRQKKFFLYYSKNMLLDSLFIRFLYNENNSSNVFVIIVVLALEYVIKKLSFSIINKGNQIYLPWKVLYL
jgi:hypothetical protein